MSKKIKTIIQTSKMIFVVCILLGCFIKGSISIFSDEFEKNERVNRFNNIAIEYFYINSYFTMGRK